MPSDEQAIQILQRLHLINLFLPDIMYVCHYPYYFPSFVFWEICSLIPKRKYKDLKELDKKMVLLKCPSL